MGNSLGGKKRTAKVMKIDGTTFRLKPPAQVGDVLKDHPGFDLLKSDEVKQLGVRAMPLAPEHPLQPGKIYFLVELPRLPDHRAPRRAWSGAIHVSAKDRLESLKLSRRSVSDVSLSKPLPIHAATAEQTPEGAMRIRMKLPRAQVAKLMEETKDPAEAAAKVVELFVARENKAETPPPPPAAHTQRKEKRARFVATADEVIA